MAYKRGDFWRIDDHTGFRVRSSRTSKEWTGLISVNPDIRNPQDFVRGRVDYQNVPEPRPEAADVFIDNTGNAAILTEVAIDIEPQFMLFTQSGLPILTE